MTRDEAIYRLKNTAWLGTDKDREETEQAVNMAIEALETLQSEPMITRCKDCFLEDCKAKEFYGENGFCSIGRRKRNEIDRR